MDHKTCAITTEEETNCLTYEFLIQFTDTTGQPLDTFTPRWVSYTFAVENNSVFKQYCKQAGLLFMLSKPKPLSLKERKALKEKKLTQMFGDTIQIESEEIGEKDEADYEINDLAEIEVDNQIYDEEFIERATEYEEPILSPEPSTLKKQKKQKETLDKETLDNRNNTSKMLKSVKEPKRKQIKKLLNTSDDGIHSDLVNVDTRHQIQSRKNNNKITEESTLRRSNRQRRPNVNYTGY